SPGRAVAPVRRRPARVVAVVWVRSTAIVIAGAAPVIVAVILCAAVVTRPAILAGRIRAGATITGSTVVARAARAAHAVNVLIIAIAAHHLRAVLSRSCLGLRHACGFLCRFAK